jgi:hypothetical protein
MNALPQSFFEPWKVNIDRKFQAEFQIDLRSENQETVVRLQPLLHPANIHYGRAIQGIGRCRERIHELSIRSNPYFLDAVDIEDA